MSGDFPLPEVDFPPARAFYEAAERGELVIPRCAACRAYAWYPGERCRTCGAVDLPFEPVSGRGTLFSWAVVHRALVESFADRVPYVPALVAIAEDPAVRLVTRLVDCEPSQLRADMPLRVTFRPLEFTGVSRRVVAPFFAPAEPGAG